MIELLTPENLIALLTLTVLEIVLGIDNIVFITILCGKLEARERDRARKVGLLLAMLMRVGLLFAISWVMGLTRVLFTVFEHGISGRSMILLFGGLFLIGKATFEIHDKLEGEGHARGEGGGTGASFRSVIAQILVLDLVFSLDSVITAVGMARSITVMVIAVVLAVGVMMVFAKAVGDFVEKHPTMKMLALSFLILVGVLLVAESFEAHIERGYVYFAMAFALAVEFLNLRVRARTKPVELRGPRFE